MKNFINRFLLFFAALCFLTATPTKASWETAHKVSTGLILSYMALNVGVYSLNAYQKQTARILAQNSLVPLDIQKIIIQKTRSSSPMRTQYASFIEKFPWKKNEFTPTHPNEIQEQLNKTHLGLDAVKNKLIEKIMAHYATSESRARIVCLVGSPETGKKTLIQSIAKAMSKEFYSIDASSNGYNGLNGYNGIEGDLNRAQPGEFAKALQETQTTNPVVMIEEVDKASPNALSTLLKAFNPQQSARFSDQFLGFDIDLFDVLFIATATDIAQIPAELRAHMEIIELADYTQEEKISIATERMLPQLIQPGKLPEATIDQLKAVVPTLVSLVVRSSTKTSGLKAIESSLKSLMAQQIAAIAVDPESKPFDITVENLKSFIDPYFSQLHLSEPKDPLTHCNSLLKHADIPTDIFKKVEQKVSELSIWKGAASLISGYIEWVVKFPFNKTTTAHPSLHDAMTQLNKTHSGILAVKELILDYLAGILTSKNTPSKTLCLWGMPGIGKTTVAESIATALGKKFSKISFGSLTSLSAEKSGNDHCHAPGPIAKAIIEAGTLNPVILLDELEKAPESLIPQLLEILDPSQNKAFKDEYLNFEIDLSNITFIASVNSLNELSRPLRDRMQIVSMHPYSRAERIEIGHTKLVPEIAQLMNFGPELQAKLDQLVEPLVAKIIRYEAGVRELKRALMVAAEKYARQILMQPEEIRSQALTTTLSATEILTSMNPEFLQTDPSTISSKIDCVGVANGMYAQGTSGGGLMKIEAIVIPHGSGQLKPNKLVGDMFVESQNRVFSYVKRIADHYKINPKKFMDYDVMFGDQSFINVDGPSAGIAQAAALISALTGRTVKQNFAMTGAIDMHGNTLPVGGYRDKILGSEQAGIQNIIVPECSRPTIEAIKKDFPTLNIFYVSTVPEALELLLNPA